ncbi:threonine--tRNA ligase [Buchnera aphidicola]|uniref:threonine--tRNA ligase n=1 Tax=Buchnera aphidicola TaxID=9 RepID=UPI0020926531|nr:threonine--tRNA ligase [Buchnera aphidicola]USS94219.1 threonine--tRNA ligase [Buchnera aphidicola (Sipha maydis)]
MPIITFSDGSKKEYKNFISIREIIQYDYKINEQNYISALLNNTVVDLDTKIQEDSQLFFIHKNDKLALNIIRNTCIQLFSYSIKILWPEIKLCNFFLNKNNFYYDFYKKTPLKKRDICLIENKMNSLIKKKYIIFKKNVFFRDFEKKLKNLNESFKLKILKKNFQNQHKINFYLHENHIDFLTGIQAPNINFCKYFKLNSISGVYWNNKKSNIMIQRISGVVFQNKKELQKYVISYKERKKFDHRKINSNLDLFHLQKNSPGMVFWHHNGWFVFKQLENFIRNKLKKFNYQEVKTPFLMNKLIWKQTGHLENYENLIFSTSSEDKKYCIKPMNCPGHIEIFNYKLRSYKELPIRISEFGSCHRNEFSGSLHGLMRLRNFTQDDAHIFCRKSQLKEEINNCIKMIYDIYNIFSFKKILVKLSTRPKKRIGSNEVWDYTESILKKVLIENKILFSYQVGEGAFYGPKIEFELQDSFNRTWQCGTIQLDFYLPKRLKSYYISKKNLRKNPVLIHRAILGSLERFIGILLEEYKGYLPLWLVPIQVKIINVSEKNIQYCLDILKKLESYKIRAKIDSRNKSVGSRVRDNVLLKIPYILICGNHEYKNNIISVREYSNEIVKISLLEFIKKNFHKNCHF